MRLLAALLILFSCALQAQEQHTLNERPWVLGARAHYGFLWPHRPAAWYLVEGHASAFEVHAERRFKDDQPWQRLYKGASYGFGILYSDMASPDVIGGGVRLVPYLHLPFIHGQNSSLGMRLGWGVGYIFKPFDRRENNRQIANGSRLNTAIQMMLEYRVDIRRVRLSTGISIDHWSNGSMVLPNLGLNFISVNAGVAYKLKDPHPVSLPVDTTRSKKRAREQTVTGAFGISEVGKPLSGQYSAFALVGQVQWNVTPKSSFAAGVDVFNKGALQTRNPELHEQGRMAHTQLGVHGGWALGFGHGELMVQMGAYVYTPMPDESPFFHRMGLRYRTGNHLIWHMALKSHWAVADHWEWGVGYRWH